MSRLWNWSALLIAVAAGMAVGEYLGARQADAACDSKCLDFLYWTDKESDGAEDFGKIYAQTTLVVCHFVGNTNSGMNETQGASMTRKYAAIDFTQPNLDCAVICYRGNYDFGRAGCAGGTTVTGTEYDIECYVGCQNMQEMPP